MKQSTREELINFLQNHYYDEYNLMDLFFNFYAEREFSSIDEIVQGIDEFYDFLSNNLSLIKLRTEHINQSDLPKLIEIARKNIKKKFTGSMVESQRDFAKNVETMVGSSNLGNILEVGAGHIPISSLYLAKKAKRVTAMDSYFYLSQQALKNMNVIPVQEFMQNSTDVSEFDIVIGRAPCSGIVPIVSACKKSNKPYIILLCDCALKPELKADTEALGWEKILPEIDPDIRFHGQYAFNFELTPAQIKQLIINYTRQPLKQRINSFIEFDPDFPDFE